MTRDRLDEIKNKWNIPVTLPMAVPYGKDDVVWLVQEIERLRAEAKRADEEATTLANSDLATTEQIVRALRAENAALRAEAKRAIVRALRAENAALRAEAKRADEEATTLANSDLATTEQIVRALRAENAALRVENARLRRGENARLRAAQSEDTPPTCEFCDKLRCACVKPEPDAFRRLRTCFDFDEDAPLEDVIKAVLQRFDGELRLVAENARLREAVKLGMHYLKGRYPIPVKEAEVLAKMQAALDGQGTP